MNATETSDEANPAAVQIMAPEHQYWKAFTSRLGEGDDAG
jgi:hypothetical protein